MFSLNDVYKKLPKQDEGVIHFIGIGGVGMSALVQILLAKGFRISGSDMKEFALKHDFEEQGAKIFIGHDKENIASDVAAVVISSAIHQNNPELMEANRRNISILHRSDVNAELMNASECGIAIAGSHGKTTTTSMVGFILQEANFSPTIMVGGRVDFLHGNGQFGQGKFYVSEADESDGSFLKLRPKIAIITNVEDDHLDFYETIENIHLTFDYFLKNLQEKNGLAVVCFDNPAAKKIAQNSQQKIISYALQDETAEYLAKNIVFHQDETSFDVFHREKFLGHFTMKLMGRHNVSNALAAIVCGLNCGVSIEQLQKSFKVFQNAKRRFETKYKDENVWIVDDYAHHPTEIAMTLQAAKQTNPKRLICVFQPHRYSRTKLLAHEFAHAFDKADELILTDIYSAGEKPIEAVTGEVLFRAVQHPHKKYIADRKELAPHLKTILQKGDLILTMGAGDIFKTGEELCQLV